MDITAANIAWAILPAGRAAIWRTECNWAVVQAEGTL